MRWRTGAGWDVMRWYETRERALPLEHLALMLIQFQPIRLSDLFDAFEVLQRGDSVVLGPATVRVETEESPVAPALGVYSSGSTGAPKLVWRPWTALLGEVHSDGRSDRWTWASSFSPESFAGVQVALQAWRTQGQIISLGGNWDENWALLNQHRPEALSCTPTFLDLLLQFGGSTAWLPRQITLGGEVLRPGAGQRFASHFPGTRFSVIYASAEHGVLLKTHRLDGWYEMSSLTRRAIEWRVKDDVLEVQKNGEWISTGDQIEAKGDLIRVVGRVDSVANVGGVKVSLDEVARAAEEVTGVRRALAFVEPNAVVGQVVGLKFAPEPGVAIPDLQQRLQTHLRSRLTKQAWPRHWELDLVGIGSNSKRALQR